MNNDIYDAVQRLQRRLRWAKRFRILSTFLFLAPLIGFPLLMLLTSLNDHGPEKGMSLLPFIHYGLLGSPLLLLPLIAWAMFSRRCRIIQERLSLLPSLANEQQVA